MRVVRSQVWLAAIAAGLVFGFGSVSSASEKGKQLFVKHGCWQCHGFVGQGGIAGPALVPEVMPLEAMVNFVRNSSRSMPPYTRGDPAECGFDRDPRLSGLAAEAGRSESVPLLNQ